jgi:hypothetical protein
MSLFNVSPGSQFQKQAPVVKANFLGRSFVQIGTVLALTLPLALLSGCSKEQELDKRKQTLVQFCTQVTQHLLDRNPDTIQESLSQLMHEELTDKAREKLENTKVIPDSPITVMREKAESTQAHKSNQVEVKIVRALTPVEKDQVTYKITGTETTLVDGKKADDHTFSFTMICELTPDMGGYPRVVDVDGLAAKTAAAATTTPAPASKKRKHR